MAALPYFTDKDSSTYTFPKGRFLPVNEPIKPRQLVGKAGGGQVKVTDLGDAEETFPFVVQRITKTQRDNLLAFFADPSVNYKQYAFNFTDEDATTISVRLWSNVLDFPLARGNLYNVKFTVRKEIE
jgi:hypothetical protein